MNKKNGEKGFTIVELLVVIGIIAILSVGLVFYGRTAERQLILFKEQQKIITNLQKAKSLAINTFNDQTVPCGYGVHFEMPITYFIFKEESPSSNPTCSDIDFIYTDPLVNPSSKDEIFGQKEKLDLAVKFNKLINADNSNLGDIIFMPPDPTVYIDGDNGIVYGLIEVATIDDTASAIIKVNNFGQITSQ